MRKVIKFLAMAFVMFFVAVSCKPKVEPIEFTGYQFEEVVNSDYELMQDLYQDSFMFYESMVTYQYNLDTCVECNPVIQIVNVFQTEDYVHMFYHFADTNVFKEINEMCDMMTTEYVCKIDTNETDYFVQLTVHDLWLGDIRIIKDSIGITLDSAYRALLSVNQKTPESNLVSMRQPITAPPFMTHPIYIFGNMMDNIIIDGMTGRVIE